MELSPEMYSDIILIMGGMILGMMVGILLAPSNRRL